MRRTRLCSTENTSKKLSHDTLSAEPGSAMVTQRRARLPRFPRGAVYFACYGEETGREKATRWTVEVRRAEDQCRVTSSALRTVGQSFENRAAALVYLFRFGMVTPLPARREICSIRTTSKNRRVKHQRRDLEPSDLYARLGFVGNERKVWNDVGNSKRKKKESVRESNQARIGKPVGDLPLKTCLRSRFSSGWGRDRLGLLWVPRLRRSAEYPC